MNKKQLKELYWVDLDIATCHTCGMRKYGMVGLPGRPTIMTLDDTSRCCRRPDYHWRG